MSVNTQTKFDPVYISACFPKFLGEHLLFNNYAYQQCLPNSNQVTRDSSFISIVIKKYLDNEQLRSKRVYFSSQFQIISPSLQGSQGIWLYPQSTHRENKCLYIYLCSASSRPIHSPGPKLWEWYFPQQAILLTSVKAMKTVPHRHVYRPTWTRQFLIKTFSPKIKTKIITTDNNKNTLFPGDSILYQIDS